MKKIRNKSCKKCSLHKTTKDICLLGDGPYPTDIMIVGQSPSKYNPEKPISGKAGKILDVILEELDLSREDVYITNIVKCMPPYDKIPTMKEIRECRTYLMGEINLVKPKFIIALGSLALKGIMDSFSYTMESSRGKSLKLKTSYGTVKVIPTYHPATALKKNYYANLIYSDLCKFLSDKETPENNEENVVYKYVSKLGPKLKSKLIQSKKIAIDLETQGFDYTDSKKQIIMVNLAIKEKKSYVFKWENIKEHLQEILDSKELVINHNIKFDLQWLMKNNIIVKVPIFDTMVAKHLLDENYPDKSLKHLSRVECGMEELSELSEEMKKHWKEDTMPTTQQWTKYGGADVDAVMRLYSRYVKQLKKEKLIELMNLEMLVLMTLTRMEFFGFKIDLKRHAELTKIYEKDILKIETQLKRQVGGDINLNSTKQLSEVLFDKLKLPILSTTPSGNPSCNEDTLTVLLTATKDKNKKKFIEGILELRKLTKIKSVYLDGLIKNNLLKEDSKIHCDFKITGTKTGRLSCSDPNLQNIPRDGEIKSMFISSFKDGQILQVDYSQAELRILAHYSNDKKLIEAFRQGRDIHTETTSKALHKPYDEVTPHERKVVGKKVNFGIIYLIGPKGLSDNIGCTEKEARDYIHNWFAEFHKAKEWMDQKKEDIISTGKSFAYNGRTRRLYGASHDTPEGREALRQGVNSPIQGGAGDITKYNMMRLDNKLEELKMEARVISNVHDAVMVDCPQKEVKNVIKLIKDLFREPPVELKVPLEFEIKVGSNWKKLEVVK